MARDGRSGSEPNHLRHVRISLLRISRRERKLAKMRDWCHCTTHEIRKDQNLHRLTADTANLTAAIDAVARVVPKHYASESRVADILERLGKKASAAYVRDKLPTTARLRFGELGEILATSYVTDYSSYKSIYKLRWKDHREMAMRGDDILAVFIPDSGSMRFLKGEVKSRASLTSTTVRQARVALRASKNRPTPHALAAFADRLNETGNAELSNAIIKCQYDEGIKLDQVTHLLFTFSGNDPGTILNADLTAYKGKVRQHVVGLQIDKPSNFVSQVYGKVIKNG